MCAWENLVNCPTWWSLLFIFGFLCWSSYFPSQIQRNIVLGRTLLLSALPSKDIGPQICALIIRFFHFWSMLKVLTRSVLILFISLNRALLNNLQPKVGCWASAFHGCGILTGQTRPIPSFRFSLKNRFFFMGDFLCETPHNLSQHQLLTPDQVQFLVVADPRRK